MIRLVSSMRPIMRTWSTWLGLVLLAAFVAIRFVPVRATSNPPVTGDVPAPPAAKAILHRACYDCHSNEMRWPWYSRVAPVSWLVVRDVRRDRNELNFSSWGSIQHADTGEEAQRELGGSGPRVRWTTEDRAVLRNWAIER